MAKNRLSAPAAQVVAALIAAVGAVLVGWWQFGSEVKSHLSSASPAPSVPENWQVSGRVVDAETALPIKDAKIALDHGGVPAISYSDSEGVFSFLLPTKPTFVRMRVEHNGYERYDRRIDGVTIGEPADIRLVHEPRRPLRAEPTEPLQPSASVTGDCRFILIRPFVNFTEIAQPGGRFQWGHTTIRFETTTYGLTEEHPRAATTLERSERGERSSLARSPIVIALKNVAAGSYEVEARHDYNDNYQPMIRRHIYTWENTIVLGDLPFYLFKPDTYNVSKNVEHLSFNLTEMNQERARSELHEFPYRLPDCNYLPDGVTITALANISVNRIQ